MEYGLADPRPSKCPETKKILLVTPLQPAVRYEKEKEAISSWKDMQLKKKSMLLHPFLLLLPYYYSLLPKILLYN